MSADAASTFAQLRPLFREAFPQADVDLIGPMTVAADVRGWDSMAHVALIVAIEDEFAVRFEPEEVVGFESVGQLVAMIQSKARSSDASAEGV